MTPMHQGVYFKMNMMEGMSVIDEWGESVLQAKAVYSLEWIIN